jgi:hypothetical protein
MSPKSKLTDAMYDGLRVSKDTVTLNGSTTDTSKRRAFSISEWKKMEKYFSTLRQQKLQKI